VCRELYPSSRFLFMYRDVEKLAKSVYRSTLMVPSAHLMVQLGRFSGHAMMMMLKYFRFEVCDQYAGSLRMDNDFMFGTLLAVLMTGAYHEMRQGGVDMRAVCYEHLVARPLDLCRCILEFCHLPTSLSEKAVRAFNVDSQRNSPISRSILGHLAELQMTPQIKERLNELLAKFEMPLIGEPGVLEGTLTCS